MIKIQKKLGVWSFVCQDKVYNFQSLDDCILAVVDILMRHKKAAKK